MIAIRQNLEGQIKKVAHFLGKSLTDEQLAKLVHHLTFENLSKNSAVNKEDGKKHGVFNADGNFMRKGTSIGLIAQSNHLFF